MTAPPKLSDLPKSPERRLLEAAVALLRADALLVAVFKPIVTVETVTREAFLNYGINSMVVQPVSIKAEDRPSQRSTSLLGIWISAYLPGEAREENSALVGLDLGSYLRKIFWGAALNDTVTADPISFAVTDFKQLTPLVLIDGATRILTYQATFETDIDPRLGDFSG